VFPSMTTGNVYLLFEMPDGSQTVVARHRRREKATWAFATQFNTLAVGTARADGERGRLVHDGPASAGRAPAPRRPLNTRLHARLTL